MARLKQMPKMRLVGRFYNDNATANFLARVPIMITTIPEVPEVVTIGRETYIRIHTDSLLAYRKVFAVKGTKVR